MWKLFPIKDEGRKIFKLFAQSGGEGGGGKHILTTQISSYSNNLEGSYIPKIEMRS